MKADQFFVLSQFYGEKLRVSLTSPDKLIWTK